MWSKCASEASLLPSTPVNNARSYSYLRFSITNRIFWREKRYNRHHYHEAIQTNTPNTVQDAVTPNLAPFHSQQPPQGRQPLAAPPQSDRTQEALEPRSNPAVDGGAVGASPAPPSATHSGAPARPLHRQRSSHALSAPPANSAGWPPVVFSYQSKHKDLLIRQG